MPNIAARKCCAQQKLYLSVQQSIEIVHTRQQLLLSIMNSIKACKNVENITQYKTGDYFMCYTVYNTWCKHWKQSIFNNCNLMKIIEQNSSAVQALLLFKTRSIIGY